MLSHCEDQAAGLVFQSLSQCPEQLELLATWHHQAWGTGSLDERRQRLQKHLSEDAVPTSFIAFLNGQPVGSISLVHYQRLGESPNSVWIANLYVIEAKRRQGIGEALLRHAEQYARQLLLPQLFLYATDQEAFYQKRGWLVRRRGEFRRQPAAVMFYPLRA
ncbi:GNAT family N-acetyltransferase [Maricurvus nonylphenolicus]|uniref:GNAT family N-acetyltransferase n=1 Tax=Maricurvus nonylphenolicus TaxID=1008307 RepID=UPI0036F27D58